MLSAVEVALLYLATTFAFVRGFQLASRDYTMSGRFRAAIWLAIGFAIMGVHVR